MYSNNLKVLFRPAAVITVDTGGRNFKRGSEMKNLTPLYEHSIIIENDIIKDIVQNRTIKNTDPFEIVDLKDKTILPGLIESHTHTAFAGSRAAEFRAKLSGATYEEIARKGGGILTTVQAVRESTADDLLNLIKPRIYNFISQGITTLEIKSGYGLDFENEVKLLRVINQLNNLLPIDIVPTFLGAHTFPPEYKNNRKGYVELITEKLLPYISENKLARFCDAFCEETAFTPQEVDLIFSKASSLGLALKLHTDQFNSIGGIDTAVRHKAVSIDHLEVIGDKEIQIAKNTDIVFTLLPGVSFFLNYGYAPARKLIDADAVVSLSTDYNPGSSNISSLHLIMSIAAIQMKMSIEEVITSVTINAAKALSVNEFTGSIEPGKKADFSIINTTDYADLVYNIGSNLNVMTIKDGKIIYDSTGGIN